MPKFVSRGENPRKPLLVNELLQEPAAPPLRYTQVKEGIWKRIGRTREGREVYESLGTTSHIYLCLEEKRSTSDSS